MVLLYRVILEQRHQGAEVLTIQQRDADHYKTEDATQDDLIQLSLTNALLPDVKLDAALLLEAPVSHLVDVED